MIKQYDAGNFILEGIDSEYGQAFSRSIHMNSEVSVGHTFEGVPDGAYCSYERNGVIEMGIYKDGELVQQLPGLEF